MVSSNIAVSHADIGLVTATVKAAELISPHFVRVTVAGEYLTNWRNVGFDQWFRLAVPTTDETRFDNMSDKFGFAGYLKYLTLPKATRPVIRNYTVRTARPEVGELDIDFVVHGTAGVAGPWAAGLPLGDTVGLIDQGAGYIEGNDNVLLVGDESALPAVLGILRDSPAHTRGTAIIEVPDVADIQEVSSPEGVDVRWIIRADEKPGALALAEARTVAVSDDLYAFAAGESALATGVRRFLVSENGLDKSRVTFCGYYKLPTPR